MKKERLKMKLNGQELQLCKGCHTMKHMTRELCFRCLDRNDIKEEFINKIKNCKKPVLLETQRKELIDLLKVIE